MSRKLRRIKQFQSLFSHRESILETELYSKFEVKFGLEITGEKLRPDDVDAFLGLLHTHGFNKGEGTACGGPPWGAWAYRSSFDNPDEELDDRLLVLLSIFEPIQDKLDYYINSDEYTVAIRIYYENNLEIASISINSNILTRLARLCNNLYISLIGDTEKD